MKSDKSDSASSQPDAPNYDVVIDADELLADLADRAAEYAEDYAEKDRWWRESLDYATEHTEARYWALEALGGRTAYARVIATLQPENNLPALHCFLEKDGTVAVRDLMSWLSNRQQAAHDDAHGPYTETRQASEAASAYAKILSLIRDDYGVGWPRLDDVSGTPLESDLP